MEQTLCETSTLQHGRDLPWEVKGAVSPWPPEPAWVQGLLHRSVPSFQRKVSSPFSERIFVIAVPDLLTEAVPILLKLSHRNEIEATTKRTTGVTHNK